MEGGSTAADVSMDGRVEVAEVEQGSGPDS